MEAPKHVISDESYFNNQPLKKPSDPLIPDWFTTRPCISDDFMRLNTFYPKESDDSSFLQHLPIPDQEQIIVEDLLYTLMGIDGKYIQFQEDPKSEGPSWVVSEHFHHSLKKMIQMIMPLCTGYIEVSKFVDTYQMFEKGMIGNAISSALSSLLHDYLIHISQLEYQSRENQLTLQKLWYYIQGSIDLMNVLRDLTRDIQAKDKKGGALLNQIYHRLLRYSGDKLTTELYHFILGIGSEPYFEVLKMWIYDGKLQDPNGEFFVQEDEYIVRDSAGKFSEEYFWKKKYLFISENVYTPLETYGEKIFMTGKYINAVRECGISQTKMNDEISYSLNEREIGERINAAYAFSSSKLLEALLTDNKLMSILRSVKKFFFMEHGDLYSHFLDLAEDELKKPLAQVSVETLQEQMDVSIRVTCAKDDEYFENLLVHLVGNNLIDDLIMKHKNRKIESAKSNISGLECLSLDWKVQWPIVLVLNKNVMNSYQYLFRHLFYIRYTERRLVRTWTLHQSTRRMFIHDRKTSQKYRLMARSFNLRRRMMLLVQSIQYYMLLDVIEPEFLLLEEKMKNVKTVDELLSLHHTYIENCSKDCLLTEIEIVNVLTKLLSTCVIFSNYSERFITQLVPESLQSSSKDAMLQHKVASDEGSKSLTMMEETIKEFETNFDSQYRFLLEITSKDPSSSKLNVALDFNDFFGGVNPV